MKLVFFGKEKIIQKVSIVLLLCRYFKRDGAKYKFLYQMWQSTVFWRDFHNRLFFRREIQIPHLLEKFKKCQLLLCRYYTEPSTNVFIRCDSAQWEIFGKRQNCHRWIRFFGQIWDEARLGRAAHWEIIEDSGHDWLTWHSVCTVGFPPSWQLPFDEIFPAWHLCELNRQQINAVC